MVISKCNLKMHVRYLGYSIPIQTGAQKPPFWTTSQLNGKFNSLYLRNEIWHRQSGKCVANHKGSATSSRNDMSFGPQTTSNWKWVFTRPPWNQHSTSLPSFADGHQQTELNHTLPNGYMITISRKKVGLSLPKKWEPKNVYICSVFDDFEI